MEGTLPIFLVGFLLLLTHQTSGGLHEKLTGPDLTLTCTAGGDPISIQSAHCTTSGGTQEAFAGVNIHAKVIQDIQKKCNGLHTCTLQTTDLAGGFPCTYALQIGVECSTTMLGFVGRDFNAYLACVPGMLMNSLTFSCTAGGFPSAASLTTLSTSCDKKQECTQAVTDVNTQTATWCSTVANSVIASIGFTCDPNTAVRLDTTPATATAMVCPVTADVVYPFAIFCETNKALTTPVPPANWAEVRFLCSASNTCSMSQDDFVASLCTIKTATFAHIHCMKKVTVATIMTAACPATTDKVFWKYLLCQDGMADPVEASSILDNAREKCNGMTSQCTLAKADVLVSGNLGQCVEASINNVLEYRCGATDTVKGSTSTALKLTCGAQLMINVKKVTCFPSNLDKSTEVANANALCRGRTGTCDLHNPVSPLVALPDACPALPNGPDTIVEYECLPSLQVTIQTGSDKIQVVCPADMFIQFDAMPVTCATAPDRNPLVKDTCTGKKGSCEVTTGICVGLTVDYRCAKEISAHGGATVELQCSKDAMIKPTKVQCSEIDGSGGQTADTAKLTKAEEVCQGAHKSTVTVTDLGGTACTGTYPHALITYECVSVLTAAHPTDVKLQCGKDLAIWPIDVKCSEANGANPGTADADRLAKLKPLVQGMNSYTVTVANLGTATPVCAGTTTHTMISYKCVPELMASGETEIDLQCGKDSMIVPTDVRCSGANGVNPGPTADGARLTKLKALIEGANAVKVMVADLDPKTPDCTGATTHTRISYKCAPGPMAHAATNVQLKCGTMLMIDVKSVECSDAAGANPTGPDAGKKTKLVDMCQGAKMFTADPTQLGTACLTATPDTLIKWSCVPMLWVSEANAATSVSLKCADSLLIVPTDVMCSAAGGASPGSTDTGRLDKLKMITHGLASVSFSFADLGAANPVCAQNTQPNTLVKYKCVPELMASGLTEIHHQCGKDSMIVPTDVRCSGANGLNPGPTPDAARLTKLKALIEGANVVKVMVTDLDPKAPDCTGVRTHTRISYKCAPGPMAHAATNVQLKCGTMLMIDVKSVECSDAAGANPTGPDAGKKTKLVDMCQGAKMFTADPTQLGTACLTATPDTLIKWSCVPMLWVSEANAATSVSLKCADSLLIVPTDVMCSAAGGASPGSTDTGRLDKLKMITHGLASVSFSFADLGAASPVCALNTQPNTLVKYKCVPELMASGLTEIHHQCGKDSMIVPTDVRCSGANGVNPGPTPDAARLTKLKALIEGANVVKVMVTDLDPKAPDCTGVRTHTRISYKCAPGPMAHAATNVQLKCGTMLMIDVKSVECSDAAGANPTGPDAGKRTKLVGMCQGAKMFTADPTQLGTACLTATPDTLIKWSCVPMLWVSEANAATSVSLKCADSLFIVPHAVMCSAADGASPGNPDIGRLDKLRMITHGLASALVKFPDLGTISPACTSTQTNTLIRYTCAKEYKILMANGPAKCPVGKVVSLRYACESATTKTPHPTPMAVAQACTNMRMCPVTPTGTTCAAGATIHAYYTCHMYNVRKITATSTLMCPPGHLINPVMIQCVNKITMVMTDASVASPGTWYNTLNVCLGKRGKCDAFLHTLGSCGANSELHAYYGCKADAVSVYLPEGDSAQFFLRCFPPEKVVVYDVLCDGAALTTPTDLTSAKTAWNGKETVSPNRATITSCAAPKKIRVVYGCGTMMTLKALASQPIHLSCGGMGAPFIVPAFPKCSAAIPAQEMTVIMQKWNDGCRGATKCLVSIDMISASVCHGKDTTFLYACSVALEAYLMTTPATKKLSCAKGMWMQPWKYSCPMPGANLPMPDIAMAKFVSFFIGETTKDVSITNVGSPCGGTTDPVGAGYMCTFGPLFAMVPSTASETVTLHCAAGNNVLVIGLMCKSQSGTITKGSQADLDKVVTFCAGKSDKTNCAIGLAATFGGTSPCGSSTDALAMVYSCVKATGNQITTVATATTTLECTTGGSVFVHELVCEATKKPPIDGMFLEAIQMMCNGLTPCSIKHSDLPGGLLPCGAASLTNVHFKCTRGTTVTVMETGTATLRCSSFKGVVIERAWCSDHKPPSGPEQFNMFMHRCYGMPWCKISMADLGPKKCAPGAHIVAQYICGPNIWTKVKTNQQAIADNNKKTVLACGVGMMIQTGPIKCRAAGQPDQNGKTEVYKRKCRGALKSVTTVEELGSPCAAFANTEVYAVHTCVQVFSVPVPTVKTQQFNLMCGEGLMVDATLKCKAAVATATPTLEEVLDKAVMGANNIHISAEDLHTTGVLCNPGTDQAWVEYVCRDMFVVPQPGSTATVLKMDCGANLMIVPKELKCPEGSTTDAGLAAIAKEQITVFCMGVRSTNSYPIAKLAGGSPICSGGGQLSGTWKCAKDIKVPGNVGTSVTTFTMRCAEGLLIDVKPTGNIRCSDGSAPKAAEVAKVAKCHWKKSWCMVDVAKDVCTSVSVTAEAMYQCHKLMRTQITAGKTELMCPPGMMVNPVNIACENGDMKDNGVYMKKCLGKMKSCEFQLSELGGEAALCGAGKKAIAQFMCSHGALNVKITTAGVDLQCPAMYKVVIKGLMCKAKDMFSVDPVDKNTLIASVTCNRNDVCKVTTAAPSMGCTGTTPDAHASYVCAKEVSLTTTETVAKMECPGLTVVPVDQKCAGSTTLTTVVKEKLAMYTKGSYWSAMVSTEHTFGGTFPCGSETYNAYYTCSPDITAIVNTANVRLTCAEGYQIQVATAHCFEVGYKWMADNFADWASFCTGIETCEVNRMAFGNPCEGPTEISYKCVAGLVAAPLTDKGTGQTLKCPTVIVADSIKCMGKRMPFSPVPAATTAKFKTDCDGQPACQLTVKATGGSFANPCSAQESMHAWYHCAEQGSLVKQGNAAMVITCPMELNVVVVSVVCATGNPLATCVNTLKSKVDGLTAVSVTWTDLGCEICAATATVRYQCHPGLKKELPATGATDLKCPAGTFVMAMAFMCRPKEAKMDDGPGKLTKFGDKCRGKGACPLAATDLGGAVCTGTNAMTTALFKCTNDQFQEVFVDKTAEIKCTAPLEIVSIKGVKCDKGPKKEHANLKSTCHGRKGTSTVPKKGDLGVTCAGKLWAVFACVEALETKVASTDVTLTAATGNFIQVVGMVCPPGDTGTITDVILQKLMNKAVGQASATVKSSDVANPCSSGTFIAKYYSATGSLWSPILELSTESTTLTCPTGASPIPLNVDCHKNGAVVKATAVADALSKLKTFCLNKSPCTFKKSDIASTNLCTDVGYSPRVTFDCQSSFEINQAGVKVDCTTKGTGMRIDVDGLKCEGTATPSAEAVAKFESKCSGMIDTCPISLGDLGTDPCGTGYSGKVFGVYSCVAKEGNIRLPIPATGTLMARCSSGEGPVYNSITCADGSAVQNNNALDNLRLWCKDKIPSCSFTAANLGSPAACATNVLPVLDYKCVASSAAGVRCYVCNSGASPLACGETSFAIGGGGVAEKTGCTYCAKTIKNGFTTRDCVSECVSKKVVTLGTTDVVECCRTDGCNGSGRSVYSLLLIVCAALLATWLRRAASSEG